MSLRQVLVRSLQHSPIIVKKLVKFSTTSSNLVKKSDERPPDLKISQSRALSKSNTLTPIGTVLINYRQGFFEITVPLLSTAEKCRFTLKPIAHTAEDLANMLRQEDDKIQDVSFKNSKSVRIGLSTNIETLLQEDALVMVLNDNVMYNVDLSSISKIDLETIFTPEHKIDTIKCVLEKLYVDLDVQTFLDQRENDLEDRLKSLEHQLRPLEAEKEKMDRLSHRLTNWLSWSGLGLMAVQFGMVARLTWWDSSWEWDSMEPITYFVTYANVMAAFAYFVVTRQEYRLNAVRKRTLLVWFYKQSRLRGFDVEEYNRLKKEVWIVQSTLRRLRDPLRLRVHRHIKDIKKRHS